MIFISLAFYISRSFSLRALDTVMPPNLLGQRKKAARRKARRYISLFFKDKIIKWTWWIPAFNEATSRRPPMSMEALCRLRKVRR
jgi:hypothetical protein